jgi:hypothetical protein
MERTLAVVGLVVVSAIIWGCGPACRNEPIASIPSPSGENTAVVFSRSCGATTGFNTQVSVLRGMRQLPSEVGNTLVIGGTVPLQVRWLSESRLSVTGIGAAQVFKQVSLVEGIAISYE